MLTYLGKFLVLLNAFAAVAVTAWAVSAYSTRLDAVDAVDADGEKLVDKVKRLDKKAADAQGGYAPALVQVADADARLATLREQIARRLKQADGGTFYNIYTTAGPNVKDPANPNALDRVDRVVWTDDPKQQIKGLDGKPLSGVQQVRKLLDDEQKAAGASIDAIEKSAQALTALNAEVTALDARFAWLDEVGKRHAAELPVLSDLRVNWENRSGSLQRRRTQLLLRLEDLKGSKVGTAPVPTVPPPAGPSEFTLTPKK
jgi:hypothetical protein